MDAVASGPAAARGWRRYASLLVLVAAGGFLALVALFPLGPCSFKILTGAPCPGCGLTRACIALAGGDVGASLRLHPLALPGAALGAGLLLLAVREGITGRPVLRDFAERRGTALAVAAMALLAGVWIVRVVLRPDWAPDPLRPGSFAARLLE